MPFAAVYVLGSAAFMPISPRNNLRNIAIIAHVDHGKTTLVDAMLKQSGVFRQNEQVADRVMDSNDLERERGITIFAKNASMVWKSATGEVKINIIDTPGHSDFGGEVERTLMMADGAILLIDAAEGPLPQTRFVLGKALSLGMPVILMINKIDRQDARPDEVLNEAFDLFVELEANDEQADFPVLYAVGKEGVCAKTVAEVEAVLGDPEKTSALGLRSLFETIIEKVPSPKVDVEAPFQMLVTNVEHDEYVGRIGIGRVLRGTIKAGATVTRIADENKTSNHRVSALFGFEGMKRVPATEIAAGDVAVIAGIDPLDIGDTFTAPEAPEALPRISVEEPTIRVSFNVNTSPFAGKAGKWVTSRHLRERLEKEAKRNLAMRFEETDSPDQFTVYGRGELMLAVLAETMRREGYEFAIGMPEVVTREVDGVLCEPKETVVIDIPDAYVGAITTSLGERKGQMTKMNNLGFGRTRMEFSIASRGLIGFRSQFLTLSRGAGLFNTQFEGWQPMVTVASRRPNGALVSDRSGTTTPYAIFNLQPRGIIFVEPGMDVYEGMVLGEHNRENDLDVNMCREKKLTNIRAAGKDENVILTPPKLHTIETAMEWIDHDELVEVTPTSVRIRKKILECNRRPKRVTE